MPKRIMELTDLQVSKAKPKEKDYKLADGKGLYLLVTTTGGKLWRFKYRFQGKEKVLALGKWSAVSLLDARKGCGDARKLLANGRDPSEQNNGPAPVSFRSESKRPVSMSRSSLLEITKPLGRPPRSRMTSPIRSSLRPKP